MTSAYYALRQTSSPATEPVSLSESKQFIRVTHSDEDTLVSTLIEAARIRVEHYLRRALITQSWRMSFDHGVGTCITMPLPPVQAISSVKTYSREGGETVISANSYYLSAGNHQLRLDTALVAHRIDIEFIAGYGDALEDIPQAIRYAILSTIGFMYDHRDVEGMPQDAKHVLFPYRIEGC